MRGRKLASGYVSRTYGGLKCFCGFLAREGMIPANPFQFVEKPRMEKKLIRPLSLEQVKALLAAFRQRAPRTPAHLDGVVCVEKTSFFNRLEFRQGAGLDRECAN